MLSAAQLTIVSRLSKRHLRKVSVIWEIYLQMTMLSAAHHKF